MFKRFRVHVKWYDGYETRECYYYCLGYGNLGKVLKESFEEEEEVVEICELVKTFKSFIVCLKKTCSSYKNECI